MFKIYIISVIISFLLINLLSLIISDTKIKDIDRFEFIFTQGIILYASILPVINIGTLIILCISYIDNKKSS